MQDIDMRPDDVQTSSPTEPERQPFRFSIGELLMLTTIVGIGAWASKEIGFWPAVFISIIPIAAIIDRSVSTSAASRELVDEHVAAPRVAVWYFGMGITGLVTYIGCAFSPAWWSPLPYLSVAIYDGFIGPYFGVNPCLYISGFAMLAHICLNGPLLRGQDVRRLPLRSTIVLIAYSITSLIYIGTAYVFVYRSQMVLISYWINLVLVWMLWFLWSMLQERWNASLIIAWNTLLLAWLFWFAHPTMTSLSR